MQHTLNWDERYRLGDTPWEDEAVAPVVSNLFDEYVPAGASVLEVGCGLGTNSLWLAAQGYRVTACDISPAAVRVATERASRLHLSIDFIVADVLADRSKLVRPDVVFDRGVLHTFTTDEGRAGFAAAVADLLDTSHLWLDISGNADNPDDPLVVIRDGYPRLNLANIATAAEPHFAVLSARQAAYGVTRARTDFLAFACVLSRR